VDSSSFSSPDNAGLGGLLKNHYGGWIQGFSASCGRPFTLFAELLAILRGLQLIWPSVYYFEI